MTSHLTTYPKGRAGRLAVLLIVMTLLLSSSSPASAAVPADFQDTLLATVTRPTGLAFTPDGRMLITTQPGALRVYQNGTLLGTPALDLALVSCSDRERGLLGVAVDPGFAANHYIYLYYTFNKFNACPNTPNDPTAPVNRVARFTLPDSNLIDPASQLVLLDNILSVGNHNGGDLHFGADGLLYISVGEAGLSSYARMLDRLGGKMLRIAADGSIPSANPYASAAGARRCGDPSGVPAGTGPCREIFAYGLRNPFRFAFRPGTNQFYINDVGDRTWEEIDEGQLGADYGWSTREGQCAAGSTTNCDPPPTGMTNPIFHYDHNTGSMVPGAGCSAITGGVFVPTGVWPAPYDGAYLFSDLVCGAIFRLVPGAGGSFTSTAFATSLGGGSVVSMIFGPYNTTQALYYTSYTPAGSGQVRRIAYTSNLNRVPVAVASANPSYGPAPLAVTLSATGSSDPDGDPLTFDWDFGDGATQNGVTSTTIGHTYASNGIYMATLTVRDNRGGVSAPASVRVDVGNTPPVLSISFPTASTRFQVGQVITLQGSATDVEDGLLPDSALSWEALLYHIDQAQSQNVHFHPFLAPTTGNNIAITAPAPENLEATALSYLEIRLIASDSTGRTTTITRTLQPNRVGVTFITQPPGLNVTINGGTVASQQTITSWEGHTLDVTAPMQTDESGRGWMFQSWSDGGARAHAISTPASAITYTAVYTPARSIWLPSVAK